MILNCLFLLNEEKKSDVSSSSLNQCEKGTHTNSICVFGIKKKNDWKIVEKNKYSHENQICLFLNNSNSNSRKKKTKNSFG